jgi:hypothetical protein
MEGVIVSVSPCDPNTNGGCRFDKIATTNAQGSYRVKGIYAGAAGMFPEKTGFRLPDGVKVG